MWLCYDIVKSVSEQCAHYQIWVYNMFCNTGYQKIEYLVSIMISGNI